MRLLSILVVVVAVALAGAPSAHAQQDTPFGPVPTVEPAPGEDGVGRGTLYLIGLAALLGVAGIGYAISRDARRSLSAEDRTALEGERATAGRPRGPDRAPGTPGEVSNEARARARKQRSKAKAARAQRKRNRSR